VGVEFREGDEDAYHERHQHEREVEEVPVPPVDIIVSEDGVTAGGGDAEPAAESEAADVDFPKETGQHEEEKLPEDLAEDDENEEERFSDLGDADHLREAAEEEDARSLRRSSHGTTVITPADEQEQEEWSEHEGGEDHGGDDDVDDAASDWTESAVGRESDVGVLEKEMGMEGSVPVAAAS
jgi:hypothetical protein